jgi:hypothetical protein
MKETFGDSSNTHHLPSNKGSEPSLLISVDDHNAKAKSEGNVWPQQQHPSLPSIEGSEPNMLISVDNHSEEAKSEKSKTIIYLPAIMTFDTATAWEFQTQFRPLWCRVGWKGLVQARNRDARDTTGKWLSV